MSIEEDHVPAVMDLAYLNCRRKLEQEGRLDGGISVSILTGSAWYKDGDTLRSICQRSEQEMSLAITRRDR